NMAKQILYAANVGPALEQMRGKTVAQGVGGNALVQARLASRLTHGQLKRAFQQMMPAFNTRMRIKRCLAGGKEPEPFPGHARARVLAGQCFREPDASQAHRAILLVQPTKAVAMRA